MSKFKLTVTANYATGDEEEYHYKGAYDADDLLGIVKTYMEYADNASSYVFTVVKAGEADHMIEGTQANFDRYIAGDR